MVMRATFFVFILVISGCRKHKALRTQDVKIKAEVQLARALEKHEKLVFYGWNGERNNGGCHFRINFLKGGKVAIDILGYNFDMLSGTYCFNDDGSMKISFNRFDVPESSKLEYTTNWPLLKLSQDRGDLLLQRADGETAWHIDWPLHPSVVQNVWPARAHF